MGVSNTLVLVKCLLPRRTVSLSGRTLATQFCCFVQELSPTTDANMVNSHMNLMDTMMDEFHDEQKFKELNEREVAAWLEV